MPPSVVNLVNAAVISPPNSINHHKLYPQQAWIDKKDQAFTRSNFPDISANIIGRINESEPPAIDFDAVSKARAASSDSSDQYSAIGDINTHHRNDEISRDKRDFQSPHLLKLPPIIVKTPLV